MGFSRQEYWSGLLWPPPGGLPDPEVRPASLLSPALPGRSFTTSATWEVPFLLVSNVLFPQPFFFKIICLRILICAIVFFHTFSSFQTVLLYIFPVGTVIKNQPTNSGDMGSIPRWGRSPGVGNSNPLQYSRLENSMGREAGQAGYSTWGLKESEMTEHIHTHQRSVLHHTIICNTSSLVTTFWSCHMCIILIYLQSFGFSGIHAQVDILGNTHWNNLMFITVS